MSELEMKTREMLIRYIQRSRSESLGAKVSDQEFFRNLEIVLAIVAGNRLIPDPRNDSTGIAYPTSFHH